MPQQAVQAKSKCFCGHPDASIIDALPKGVALECRLAMLRCEPKILYAQSHLK